MANLISWFEFEKDDLKNSFFIYPKRRLLYLFLSVSLLVWIFYRLWMATSKDAVRNIDVGIIEWIRNLRTPALDNFFSLLTTLGSGLFIISAFSILAIFLFWRRKKRAAATVFLTLAISAFLIYFLNLFLGRPRPFGCISTTIGTSCFSFPSGHAAVSFYFYGILLYLMLRFIKLKKTQVFLLGLLLIILVLAIGFSRIYLGYHFLTDIIGGFLIGGVSWVFSAILIDFLYLRHP